MKNKIPLILVLGLVVINLLSNSCKKEDNSNIPHLLVSGTWQLASLQVSNYVGDQRISLDTLNDSCTLTQTFTFNANNTCTYTNFACQGQTTTGSWTLAANKLYFASDMVCKDTVPGGKGALRDTVPFSNAQIVTLGTYSMVLQTGNVQPNYSPTSRRRIVRYGFIRQKAITTQ
ncbi:MAG: lipocalin family protein [Mucilaginibacter sp.]|uniref:lipocalin family protein n=1 Tax=Mucilaginibacter sp. TaxID=1882438 RepID=UPI0031AF9184